MEDITSLMDVGKRVDFKYVRILFKDLLNKIVSDFFYYVNSSFNIKYYDISKFINPKEFEDIKRRIHIFLNFFYK